MVVEVRYGRECKHFDNYNDAMQYIEDLTKREFEVKSKIAITIVARKHNRQ